MQNRDFEILAHKLLICSSKERYSSNNTPSSLKLLVGPSLFNFINKAGIFWFANFIAIKYQATFYRVNRLATGAEDDEICFCSVNHHFIGAKPISNFL